MSRQRIQNQVAVSGMTLPVSATVAVALWQPWRMDNAGKALALALLALTAYTLLEWVNRFQIIRIRTRLTTALHLLGTTAIMLVAGTDATGLGIALLVLLAMVSLSMGYGSHEPVAAALHTGVCLSCAGLLCRPALWLAVAALLCMAVNIRSLSVRTLSALTIGGLLPWTLMLMWPIVLHPMQDIETLYTMEATEAWLPKAGLPHPPLTVGMAWGAASVLQGVSMLHFAMSVPDDKIRTRQLLQVTATMWIALQVIMVLWPDHAGKLLPALWITGCPLLCHHIALSRTWLTTLHFTLTAMAVAAATAWHFIYI